MESPTHRRRRALLVLAVLLALSRPALAERPLPTVAIDTRQVPARAFRVLDLLGLQRMMALRLAQAGFAVVALEKQPLITLVLHARGVWLVVEARAGARRETRPVERGSGSLDHFHLEAVHKAIQACREVVKPAASGPATRPAPPTTRSSATPVAAAASSPRSSRWYRRWQIDLTPSMMLRVDQVDPLLQLGLRVGRGFGLRAGVAVAGTFQQTITVLEWSAQLGPSYRAQLTSRLALEVSALVGWSHHVYVLDHASPEGGDAWDLLVSLPTALSYELAGPLLAGVVVAPGASTRSRTHRLDGAPIWDRSWFRVEVGVTIGLIL